MIEMMHIEQPRVLLFRKDYQMVKRIFDITLTFFALPTLMFIMGHLCALDLAG